MWSGRSPLPSTSCVSKKNSGKPKSGGAAPGCCLDILPGCPLTGAPPGAMAARRPARCLRRCANAIARPRAWLKGCPPGAGHSRLGGRRRMWRPLVGTAATSTASTPTANISIVVKHIDGGRGGEGRGRRRAPCACRRPIAASTASAMAVGSSTAMWPEMARINMQKIQLATENQWLGS